MQTIEIDFDVFKEITIRRKTEDITPNDVLREVFGLEKKKETTASKAQSGRPWVVKGVEFPSGTEFRASHKGQMYYAKVENGFLILNGKKFPSPSSAAVSITGNLVNGWVFWECKLPGEQKWQIMNSLRYNLMSK